MSDHGNGRLGRAGRPRRSVERDYAAAVGEAVTLDDWRAIVRAAADAAKGGDARAREWLARYLIGDKPLMPTDLAADEVAGVGADQDIAGRSSERQRARQLDDLLRSLG